MLKDPNMEDLPNSPNKLIEQQEQILPKSENPYMDSYDKRQPEKLNQNAPQLTPPTGRQLNKKAVIFLLAATTLLVGVSASAIYLLSSDEPETPVSNAPTETVDIPPLPPTPIIQEPIQVASHAAASTPPLPEETKEPTEVSTISPPQPEPQTYPDPPTLPPITPPDTTILPPPINQLEEQRKNDAPLIESVSNDKDGESTTSATTIQRRVRHLSNPDKLLLKGTYLRCILETKIITDVAGFTSCIITEPVYSYNGRYMLIPKGSKAMGQYNSANPNTPKLNVVWDRIVTPSGLDITLQSPGTDGLGSSGHKGKLQTHWGSKLGSAVLISLISDVFKYAAAEHGPQSTTTVTDNSVSHNPYESETANTIKQMAINQLERNNSRPNSITINQGTLINIYTAQDIDFNSIIE